MRKRVAAWGATLALLFASGILLFDGEPSDDGCGEQLVIAASREPPSPDIVGLAEVVVVSTTGSVAPITGDWVAVQPSVSPAGDEVMVVRAEGDYESSGPYHSELWAVSADGSQTRRLTTGPLDDDPDWAPRHDRIAFTRFDGRANSLMVVPSAGGEPRVVYRPPRGTQLATPAWSPDGETIAFLQAEPATATTDRTMLTVVDADGDGLRAVAPVDRTYSIDWHPDGDSLLVASEGNAYVVDTGSGNAARVATGVHSARWAPDGRRVFFTESPDGTLYEATLTEDAITQERRIAELGPARYDYIDFDVNACG